MKPTQQELTNWAIDKIKKEFKEDVALLIAIAGHATETDCHGECFDYFIPATDRGNKLAQTFIIDGVGHDLYPRSWKRIENMVELNDNFTKGLADAMILYYRSEEDKERFIAMQEQLKSNLANAEFTYRKALEKLDIAMNLYKTMLFEDALYKVRMAAGYVAYYLSLAVAYLNGSYFKQPLELQTFELSQLSEIPENFITYYELIVKAETAEELKKLCHLIIGSTRKFITAKKSQKEVPVARPVYEDLASWYQEMSLTWRRIYIHCDAQNYQRVFPDALSSQYELSVIEEEFGLCEVDLLSSYDVRDLSKIKRRAQEIEQYIISEIESHGVKLNKYDTLEDFLAKN